MATATLPSPPIEPGDARVLAHDVTWDDYEAMLRIVGERHVRVTYDGGMMEVWTPSQRHEQAAQLIGLFVCRLAEELEIPYEPLGMTTWKKLSAAKGLEPDQCYYFQNHELAVRGTPLDLENDPPPDLAIEVDISRSSLNRSAIYASLGVPEVWRYDGRDMTINCLEPGGQYRLSATSLAFSGLEPAEIVQFIERGKTTDKIRWARELREWVRAVFVPRRDCSSPGA